MTRGESLEALNHFFVTTFNRILAWEERSVRGAGVSGLSVKELHVLEAVEELAKAGRNTMSQIAARMGITLGALTTAVNVLVRKGYLTRGGDANDRRIVYAALTASGREALAIHEAFHRRMIGAMVAALDDGALAALTRSVTQLDTFFEDLIQQEKE